MLGGAKGTYVYPCLCTSLGLAWNIFKFNPVLCLLRHYHPHPGVVRAHRVVPAHTHQNVKVLHLKGSLYQFFFTSPRKALDEQNLN